MVFHIRSALPDRVHPARRPPVVRVEDTVLDLVDRPSTRAEQVIDWVLRACQRQITNPARLAEWWLPFDAAITVELREGGEMVFAGSENR